MKSVVTLILIAVAVGLLGLMAFLTLQRISSTPSPLSLKHPWVEKMPWTFVRINPCPSTPQQLEQTLGQLGPEEILWVDVRYEVQSSTWRMFCHDRPVGQLFRGQDQGPVVALQDALAALRTREVPFVLNAHIRREEEVTPLLEALKEFNNSKNLGITSPVRRIAHELRKSRPQWIFGADQPSLSRAKTFHEAGLLGLIDLWADFYVLPTEFSQTPDFAEDLRRQGKIAVFEATQFRTIAPAVATAVAPQ